jgi:hypothetical protein
MGGTESKEAPPAPTVVTKPYNPPNTTALTNLSVSGTNACSNCDISVETNISTSSVKLSRDFGNFSDAECLAYQRDRDRLGKELAFQDFFQRLQSGGYSRPTYERPANAETGETAAQFCEQVMFSEEDAAAINSIDEFKANESKLKAVRIRQVTGGGNFSSDTKAKFTLNIPLKLTYVIANRPGPV